MMKKEWLLNGAIVPVDVETTAALLAEIKRLIDVVGGMALVQPRLDQGPDYERGFVDGMQKQMQSSVDKAVNAMAQPQQTPVAKDNSNYRLDPPGLDPLYTTPQPAQRKLLTDAEIAEAANSVRWSQQYHVDFTRAIEAKLRSKNT